MPQKRYIVRLTAQEREVCRETVRKLNGSSEKVRRAQVLLKADADGPAWTDQKIADAFSCRTKTVENIRQRCVLEGFEQALERKRREFPPVPKLLNGEQEAHIIALRLGPPPKGAAYVLMQELRLHAARTACARTQVMWLRDRLLKLSVHVVSSVRRLVLHLPRSTPNLDAWRKIALSLGARAG